MKNVLKMIKSIGPKQKLLLKIVGAFFVLCICFVIVIGLFKNRTFSYSEIEEIVLKSAEKYYKEHPELLPQQDGGTVSVDSLSLIEQKYMKEFVKYNKEAEACSANVTVTNNRGYYLYIPTLKCENYTTESLYDHILKEQGTTTVKDGLYEYENDYVYRGEYPKNYVILNGRLYRILRLTSGREIRLIATETYNEVSWDDRYNVNVHSTLGITKYELSRIKDKLANVYKNDFNDVSKSYIISKKLCIGKRAIKEKDKTGKVECSTLTEETYPIGLLQANEYMIPSLDENCKTQMNSSCGNYNYLKKLTGNFWTITANSANDYEAYYISSVVRASNASEYRYFYPTLYIDGNIRYISGNGTKEDPYFINKKK